MRKVLEIHDLDFTYHTLSGETKAIQNISFDVYENEFLGIIGPSGSGKSTILSLIFGLLTPTSGTITIDQRPSESEETDIGYMLQKDHLFEWRSIYKNIMLGLEIRHQITNEKKQLINQLLNDYGLTAFKDARPSRFPAVCCSVSLSYGHLHFSQKCFFWTNHSQHWMPKPGFPLPMIFIKFSEKNIKAQFL